MTCIKCNIKITNREYLKCKICQNNYHIDCESVSYKYFQLMKRKDEWKCRKCRNLKPHSAQKPPLARKNTVQSSTPREKACSENNKVNRESLSSGADTNKKTATIENEHRNFVTATLQMPSSEQHIDKVQNSTLQSLHLSMIPKQATTDCSSSCIDRITRRKKNAIVTNIPTKNSFDSLASTLESDTDSEEEHSERKSDEDSHGILVRSCPELNTIKMRTELESLKKEVVNLQNQVLSADKQIEDLVSENCQLKLEIDIYKNKLENLSRVCLSVDTHKKKTLKNKRNKSMPPIIFETEKEMPIELSNQENDYNQDENTQISKRKNKQTNTKETSATHHSPDNNKDENTHSSEIKGNNSSTEEIFPQQDHRKILIYGTQQCVDLAVALEKSRHSTMYEKYNISAITKPFATSSEIAKTCTSSIHQVNPHDKLILCVGENDRNPDLVTASLETILDNFKDNTVLVLNILQNKYQNVHKVNQHIKNICTLLKYKNCHFIEYEPYLTFYNSAKTCNAINHVIDYVDYADKYLDVKKLKELVVRKNSGEVKYKKGTIPYFFALIESKKTENMPIKGTIPYYFPKTKKQTFFRD